MILTIITINRNNAAGLEKTMQSVAGQTCKEFEYVVVDGASTDGSVEVIKGIAEAFGDRIKWVSEPDKGIYNAMNKGIGMATGEYLQFLNSGDILFSARVVEKMFGSLEQNLYPSMLYGNELRARKRGILRDKGFAGRDIYFFDLYHSGMNHSPVYIKKDLFERYGLYDEDLKIVSDWKWFLQSIVFQGEKPVYTDIDVTLFDSTGISRTNIELLYEERRKVLEDCVPPWVLKDYDYIGFPIEQIVRIKSHSWSYKIFWLFERCLFKYEKWKRVIKKSLL